METAGENMCSKKIQRPLCVFHMTQSFSSSHRRLVRDPRTVEAPASQVLVVSGAVCRAFGLQEVFVFGGRCLGSWGRREDGSKMGGGGLWDITQYHTSDWGPAWGTFSVWMLYQCQSNGNGMIWHDLA